MFHPQNKSKKLGGGGLHLDSHHFLSCMNKGNFFFVLLERQVNFPFLFVKQFDRQPQMFGGKILRTHDKNY